MQIELTHPTGNWPTSRSTTTRRVATRRCRATRRWSLPVVTRSPEPSWTKCVGSPIAGTWCNSLWRPDDEFETDTPDNGW